MNTTPNQQIQHALDTIQQHLDAQARSASAAHTTPYGSVTAERARQMYYQGWRDGLLQLQKALQADEAKTAETYHEATESIEQRLARLEEDIQIDQLRQQLNHAQQHKIAPASPQQRNLELRIAMLETRLAELEHNQANT
ncbi:MAG: hypothetical protein HC837_00240 [Chloroflexaceae bacterium]|nr:hypothetical protein [Chloroflexaceae bacterium]